MVLGYVGEEAFPPSPSEPFGSRAPSPIDRGWGLAVCHMGRRAHGGHGYIRTRLGAGNRMPFGLLCFGVLNYKYKKTDVRCAVRALRLRVDGVFVFYSR